ncbi:hypothetical protein SODG_003520 [Sodalis praecaptivus]
MVIVLATPGADPPSVSAGEASAAAGGTRDPRGGGCDTHDPGGRSPRGGDRRSAFSRNEQRRRGDTGSVPAGADTAIRVFRSGKPPPGVHPPSYPFSLRRGSGQGTLSLRADDAPVRQVLQALAAQRGMNLVVTQGVEGEITLRLQEMPWRQALALVLTAGGLQMTRQGQTLVVSQQEAQDEQRQEKAASTASREEGRR